MRITAKIQQIQSIKPEEAAAQQVRAHEDIITEQQEEQFDEGVLSDGGSIEQQRQFWWGKYPTKGMRRSVYGTIGGQYRHIDVSGAFRNLLKIDSGFKLISEADHFEAVTHKLPSLMGLTNISKENVIPTIRKEFINNIIKLI